MPSSKNYVRDYKQESKTAKERGEHVDNATRHRARYAMVKAGKAETGDGKDVDHKTPLSKGGGNGHSNLRAVSPSENRSFARNSDGSIKSQVAKREKK